MIILVFTLFHSDLATIFLAKVHQTQFKKDNNIKTLAALSETGYASFHPCSGLTRALIPSSAIEISDLEIEHINTYIARYVNWLQFTLSNNMQDGWCKVAARVNSPLAERYTIIPWDSFRHFKISDFDCPVGESSSGDRLYSIFIFDTTRPKLIEKEVLETESKLEFISEKTFLAKKSVSVKLNSTQDAIMALWGKEKPKLSKIIRNRKINAWLKEHSFDEVSDRNIDLAYEALNTTA